MVVFYRRALILFSSLMMVGCATIDVKEDFAFGDDPNEALLVVRKVRGDGETEINFKGVNLDTAAFEKGGLKSVYLTNRAAVARQAGLLLLGGPLVAAANPGGPRSQLDDNFFVLKIPAGEYALVSNLKESFSNDGGNRTKIVTTNCFSKGASVFSLKGGAINLVVLTNEINLVVLTSENTKFLVLDQPNVMKLEQEPTELARSAVLLRDVLQEFPNVKGDVVQAEPVAAITFDGDKNWLSGPQCPKGDTIKTVEMLSDLNVADE